MRLDYCTVPDNLSGFKYYFISFMTLYFNFCLIISNNYAILFICLVLSICTYFNILDIGNQFVFLTLILCARIITYENQNYSNKKIKETKMENFDLLINN